MMNALRFLLMFVIFFVNTSLLRSQNIEAIKSSEKFKISGQFGGSMMFYGVNGRPANREGFSWILLGNPMISIYGINIPFSFTVSEQQRSFQQPFNKIGLSPYYKWAKLHLGYRNINFSKYTLGGHTILGGGGEFTPGNFTFGFMYGRLMKPVQTNPLSPGEIYAYTPSYKRNGLSLKIGYGTKKNRADIILFRGADVTESLDTTSQNALAPAENAVFSFITHQEVYKHFSFNLEYATCLYTLDSRLTDPMNDGISSVLSGFIQTNSSTYSSKVIDTYLGYDSKTFDMKVRYKQIDPKFRSMGAYFMQNDLRNITLEPSYKFGKNKYHINGSLGFQRDNLKENKAQQTNRTIGSLRFSANPVTWYRADISYSNYDISQQRGLSEIDTLSEISQTTKAINVMQNVSVAGKVFGHNIMLTLNNQKLKDKNQNTVNYTSYTSNMVIGSYVINYMPKHMSLSVTYTSSHFELPTTDSRISGPSVTYSASFFENKLSLSLTDTYSTIKTNNEVSNTINMFSINSNYKIKKKHLFRFRYYINDSNSKLPAVNPFTETKGELGYSITF